MDCKVISSDQVSNPGVLWAKKKISADAYPKIGILVNRMTNNIVISPMSETSLKTDYALRQPTRKANIYMGIFSPVPFSMCCEGIYERIVTEDVCVGGYLKR